MTIPADPVTAPRKSDLGTRTLSAIVMVAVAGGTLWLGGWVFTAFVIAVGLGVILEFWGLVRRIATTSLATALWMVAGVLYVGIAVAVLVGLRFENIMAAAFPVLLVIAVDVGAYFAGRTFGGPKIAPKISPSKTWAGLFGGMTGAALVMVARGFFDLHRAQLAMEAYNMRGSGLELPQPNWALLVLAGALVAIVAQSGDFFESWMKRRAGVKDSGNLIPGHGGLFDRVDGLLAVLFVAGLLALYVIGQTLLGGGSLLPTPA